MPDPSALSALAPAKINLALDVLGPRGDGYHEIVTIVQTLEHGDCVTLELANGSSDVIEVTGPHAADIPSGPENLVLCALAHLRDRVPALPPLRVRMEKHVPAATGLGGGASDAATALHLAARLVDAPHKALIEAAAATGSDEPALLLGGTVLATGRGECVRPLPSPAPHGVVLFMPPIAMEGKTGALFGALARQAHWDNGDAPRRLAARLPCAISCEACSNAFERVAFDVFPGLGQLRDAIETATGASVRLAGAGPTLFWLGPLAERETVVERTRGLACEVVATATAPSLWTR